MIKVRGINKEGKWLYGSAVDCGVFVSILSVDDLKKTPIDFIGNLIVKNEVERRSVFRSLGFYDNKGKEIFEGDIFTVNGKYPKTIKWSDKEMTFCLGNLQDVKNPLPWRRVWWQPAEGWWREFLSEIEVVGNVVDNSDLLGLDDFLKENGQ